MLRSIIKAKCYAGVFWICETLWSLLKPLTLIAVWSYSIQCQAGSLASENSSENDLHENNLQKYRPAAHLFLDRCASCHGSDGLGEGYISRLMPDYPPVNLLDNPEKRNRQDVRDVIEFGMILDGVSKYSPPWGSELSEKEIDQLTDLVLALRKNTDSMIEVLRQTGDNRKADVSLGALTFRTSCVTCHGATGKGDGRLARLYKNPAPADLTKSSLSIEDVREIVYKGGVAVGRSGAMPSWQGTFNKQEIESAIQYIMTLRKK